MRVRGIPLRTKVLCRVWHKLNTGAVTLEAMEASLARRPDLLIGKPVSGLAMVLLNFRESKRAGSDQSLRTTEASHLGSTQACPLSSTPEGAP